MRKFGEIIVDMEFVTQAQLDEVLELQAMGRAKIGQILVHLNYLTPEQSEMIAVNQSSNTGKKYGEIAVEMGLLNEDQLAEALRLGFSQDQSKGVIPLRTVGRGDGV